MLWTKLSVARSIKDNVHCQLGFSHGSQVLGLSQVLNVNISMKFIFLICLIFGLTLNEGIQRHNIILLLSRLKP